MTSDRPMFKSLSFRASASLIAGGGSTTEACGMFRARRAPALDASGAGATASTENEAIERLPASISGGGATTDRPMEDKSRLVTNTLRGLAPRSDWEGPAAEQACVGRRNGTEHAAVAPSNDIRCLNVLGQLDVGWSNDSLMAIVRFRRHRQNRLPGEFRFPLSADGPVAICRVERWQILGRRIVKDVGSSKYWPTGGRGRGV
jgi:hypothetical protein